MPRKVKIMAADPTPPGSDKPATGASTSGDGPAQTPAAARTTRVSAAWVAVGVALVLLTLLIVFMLQNSTKVDVKFLGAEGTIPLGLALLVAAVGGGVIVAIAAIARITQLRIGVRRSKRGRPAHD